MRLASRFGWYNSIRRERPLTDDELMQFVPSVFSGDKHESRSERYTYIPTINIINKLRDEGFQPFFACQSRVRDLGRREYSKHMLRLRREGHINGQEVPEIILLNSHDGSSSYDILLQYIQELIQQARAMVATGNYDEAVIEHINDNMNDATRQIAAFQSQVQVQQDALLVVDRQMSYMRQQLSARMLSRYQNNYHFGGSTL